MAELTCDVMAKKSALNVMGKYAGKWYAYQNQDGTGKKKLRYLRCGGKSNYHSPPALLPIIGTEVVPNYVLVGEVDMAKGNIKCEKK